MHSSLTHFALVVGMFHVPGLHQPVYDHYMRRSLLHSGVEHVQGIKMTWDKPCTKPYTGFLTLFFMSSASVCVLRKRHGGMHCFHGMNPDN